MILNANKDMETLQPLITPIIIYIIAPIITYLLTYHFTVRKAKRDFYNKALQNRYYLVYVPLRNLLLETHITGASLGFYLSQRIKRAWPYFKKLKINEGFKRFDKKFGANPLYEVEFGRDFPLEEIKKVIKKDGKWADAKLVNLIQSADRSSYESQAYSHGDEFDGLLEIEKFNLANHICDSYEKLNRRLLPQT